MIDSKQESDKVETENDNSKNIKIQKSPSEERAERLAQIDEDLKIFNYHPVSFAERQEVNEQRQNDFKNKIEELEKNLETKIDKESVDAIHKNMVEDNIEQAQKENEKFDQLKFEKQELLNINLAEDFISSLESFGIAVPQEERSRLIDVLTSPELVDFDRNELVRMMGIDFKDKELTERLSINKDLNGKFQKILRGQLVSSEYRELLITHDAKLADKEEYEKSGAGEMVEYSGQEINDLEIVDFGMEKVKQMVRDILDDNESSAGQGVFWNVLVSQKSPFVLKAERNFEDKNKLEYRERSLFYYPIIRDTIGKRFLPRQAILRSESTNRFFVLQEKQELGKMVAIKSSTIDKVIDGSYGQEVMEALQTEENKQELREFVTGAEKLFQQHQLMIDVMGDNLFFQVADGKLIIKLVDYGCFENRWGDKQREVINDIVKGQELIEKLKTLSL